MLASPLRVAPLESEANHMERGSLVRPHFCQTAPGRVIDSLRARAAIGGARP